MLRMERASPRTDAPPPPLHRATAPRHIRPKGPVEDRGPKAYPLPAPETMQGGGMLSRGVMFSYKGALQTSPLNLCLAVWLCLVLHATRQKKVQDKERRHSRYFVFSPIALSNSAQCASVIWLGQKRQMPAAPASRAACTAAAISEGTSPLFSGSMSPRLFSQS